MHDKEALEMMRRCAEEIKTNRAQRERLAPMAEAYELIRDIVGLIPKRSQGYGEDLIFVLEKRIWELEAADKKDA